MDYRREAELIEAREAAYQRGVAYGLECVDRIERAENAKLRAALEPFADVNGEGDEDFPDDTPVVVKYGRSTHYSLKLGDFRRARELSN